MSAESKVAAPVGGVDVLAVMDAACCVLAIEKERDPQRQLEQARAAVAELVEVATQIRNRCAANIAKGDYKFDNPEAKAQYDALVAALARVQGGAA